jgi:capsular exopolysaccharide synthesis family protein
MNDNSDPRRDARALPPGGPAVELVPSPPAGLAPPEPSRRYGYPVEEETHFWDYWRVLRRRLWTVISCFLATVIAVTIWTFTVRPVYMGTATLRIEKEDPRVVKFEQVVKEADSQQDYYQTQYKLLRSRALANRVIGLLQLDQHADFQEPEGEQGWLARGQAWLREWLVRWIPVPPPPAPVETEDLSLASPLTEAFLNRLSVEPVRNSRLVRVSFDSHYPDVAARVANTLAEGFIAQQLDQKVEATRYATQFLAKQLDDARGNLGESEENLNQFLKANDILFVTADKAGQPQDLITQQLTLLSDAFLKARGERIAKESLVAQASNTRDVGSLPAVLQSSLIAQLKQELVTLEGEQKKLGRIFKPDYPRMQQLAEKIAESRRQLRTEIDRAVKALQTDYEAAIRNEREIEATLAQQRSQARRLSDNMAEYNLLRREVDTSRDLYSALLGRLRETQISAALVTSNISIGDRAEIPTGPSRPRKVLNLLLACVVGLLGGVALGFFFEYLDTNIKDAKEVETVLRVPTLGLVPSRAALESRRARRRRELAEGDGDGKPLALLAHWEMASIFAEAFRSLRTSLLYSAPDHPPKTLMVTSLQPEDGKTSIVTNLAITLAQLRAGDVLVVDGDMRRPNLHEILDIPQAPGLSTFLTGQAELRDVIIATSIPNLSVIPSGRTPVNPAELLASARLRQAIDALGDRFAYIAFDTGPLFGVSDAMVLAGQVEGVVLVLRHGRASRDAAQRAIRNLMSVHARLLGVILNAVDVRGNGYYGYYGYYGYRGDHARDEEREGSREPAP